MGRANCRTSVRQQFLVYLHVFLHDNSKITDAVVSEFDVFDTCWCDFGSKGETSRFQAQYVVRLSTESRNRTFVSQFPRWRHFMLLIGLESGSVCTPSKGFHRMLTRPQVPRPRLHSSRPRPAS